jgi:hypothetical protein
MSSTSSGSTWALLRERKSGGSAIQQDSFLICNGCNSASALLMVTHFELGAKKQIKRQLMA